MSKMNVFVACPYTLFPLEDYKRSYAAVAKGLPVEFKFANESITSLHIFEKIVSYIRDSSFCIFDITGWNANVALELGVAYGLGKQYFVAFNPRIDGREEPPSDLRGIDRLTWVSYSDLEAKITFLVQQEMRKSSSSDSAIDSIKEGIRTYLADDPWRTLSEITDAVGQDKLLVQPVLRSMVASDELATKGAKRGMRYARPEEKNVRSLRDVYEEAVASFDQSITEDKTS